MFTRAVNFLVTGIKRPTLTPETVSTAAFRALLYGDHHENTGAKGRSGRIPWTTE